MTTATKPSTAAAHEKTGAFDVARIREDFPILKQTVHGQPLVYLDNAATSQKPRAVIDAIDRFYEAGCANVHRGIHALSERATRDFERSRISVQRFLDAPDAREIVFVRGATEGINLVAQSYLRPIAKPGDEIVITAMEHHSNIVPWQIVCEQTGARLRVAPISDEGGLLFDDFEKLLNSRTKLVAITHVSNALGTINPVREMTRAAHRHGAAVLVDGAQAAPHFPLSVRDLDCDFYVLSGHKMFGPTGIGVLYGKQRLLEAMPPYQGGGDMIRSVTFEKTTYNDIPYKFEAGTPHIAGAIGLGAAVEYLNSIGLAAAAEHEHKVLKYGAERLAQIPGLRLVGVAKEKASILSFMLEGVHPHDIGTILDQSGIAIRAGHHCAQPVMDRLGVPATARASLAFYNTTEEIDALVEALLHVREVFA